MKKWELIFLCLWMLVYSGYAQSNKTDHPKGILDTLNTDDKFRKVLLYDDHTWAFWDLPRPDVDEDSLTNGDWDTEVIHAYRDVEVSSLPDSIPLQLVDATHKFCLPISGFVYSKYGPRRRRPHRGVDIPLKVGDSIHAAFDGIVRISEGTSRTGGYGNLVIVRHPNGLETYYGHLSRILVKENEVVSAGEVIGLGGSTGRSTGPHLHFEMRYMGKAFDPERAVDWSHSCLRSDSLTIHKSYFSIYSHHGQTTKQSHASTDLASGQPVYYTIRKGDTLGKIAQRYHTSISKLCKLNKIKETTLLQIGRRLRVR